MNTIPNEKKLKAIIFDMDGVIIDSEPQHARAAVNVFKKHGADADLSYCMSFIGSSTKHMVEESIRHFNMNVSEETLLTEMLEEKKKLLKEEGYQPVPYVIDLIKSLHKSGLRLAIASSSTIHEITETVKALGISKYFDKLISSSHVDNPKPAPDIFNLALKELGLSNKQVIVIEDSENGTLASYAAGIPCVGFLNCNSGDQALSKASILVNSFDGLHAGFFENVLKRFLGEPLIIANTKRLLIREITPDDVKDIYQIYQNPMVKQYIDNIDDYLENEIEKQKAYIKNVYSFYGYGIWGVYSKTTGKLIGKCGIENHLVDDKEEILLSYLLDSNHWGYGYALECCHAVFHYIKENLEDVTRIAAVIDKENSRSIKTATNLNMVKEKEVSWNGRDCYLYVLDLTKPTKDN